MNFFLSRHMSCTSNPIIAQYNGLERNFDQGSWKKLKIVSFGNNFWTTWHRGLKFWHVVHIYAGHLVCQFQVTPTISFWVISVLCFYKLPPNLLICSLNGPCGPLGALLAGNFEIYRLTLLLAGNLPVASKSVKFMAKEQWSWKELILNQMGQNVLVFDHFDWDL